MAETFGTVAAALSVAALFNNCVNCFEYVKLSRNFGHDYERCQLKIDIAQTRLSRWGKAVAIREDPRFSAESPGDAPTRQVLSILEEIGLLFQAAQKKSKRYEVASRSEDLVVWQDEDMQPVVRQLHGYLGKAVRQRQKQTSIVKKAAWALYDAKQFDKLVEHITGFVDDLEAVWPAEVACRHLARLEIEEVNDEPTLTIVQETASHIDDVLADVAKDKVNEITGKNSAGKVDTKGEARVRVGDEISDNFGRDGYIVTRKTNTAATIDASDKSRVHIGEKLGGRGIFDD